MATKTVTPVDEFWVAEAVQTANGIDFQVGPNATVLAADGDFASETTATFYDFQFAPNLAPSPVDPVWETANFAFRLETVNIAAQTSTGLELTGTGYAKALGANPNGFTETFGKWSFSITSQGQFFGFTSSTDVPDGGATAVLLGLGFLGIAGLRRKLS